MTTEEQERVMRVIGGTAQGFFEHASAIMQVVEGLNNDAQIEALAWVFERFKHPAHRNNIDIDGAAISAKRLEELKQALGGMVDGLLRYIISSRMPPDTAAVELHRLIMARPTDEERSFCLYYVLLDRSVPYAPIPQSTTAMSTERFKTLQSELVTDIARIRTILGFSSEACVLADLILSVIESRTDREEKVAILAYSLGDLATRVGG